jgi:hypothetical protein
MGLVFVIAATLHAQAPVRLYPIDETDRDRTFRSYVSRLRSAVEARNTSALRKLVDEEVVVGPKAEDKGWAKFVEIWRPGDHVNSPLWPALSDLVALGFFREHPSLFLSPYLVWRFPRDLNMAAHLVVIRDKAALREAPSLDSPVTAWLSFDIVRRLGEAQQGTGLGQWIEVQTMDGKWGYVNARDAMSPLIPRAQFGIVRGRWALVALEVR